MAAILQFTTSGNMTIDLDGFSFGKHTVDPTTNVKSYITNENQLLLNAKDMNKFTNWGSIELFDISPDMGYITVSITSDTLLWYGTAQIALWVNGQCILNDNFQSGVKGPLGDPRTTKKYPVCNI
jgi:hypothetical protein